MLVANLDGIIVDSVREVFETLVSALPEDTAVREIERSAFHGEMIASIQVGGGVDGIVAVVCSRTAASHLRRNILGTDGATEDMAEIADCAGEIVNMIAGNIKTRCMDAGVTFLLSIPMVVYGKEIVLSLREKVHGLDVSFGMEGEKMRVAFLYRTKAGVEA